MFRLLKRYGLSLADLKLVYTGYIRPVMNYCTPVRDGGLTQKQIRSLKQVKKENVKSCLVHDTQIIPMLAKYVNSQRLNPEG